VFSTATDDILIAPHQPFTRVFDVTSKQDATVHLVRVSLQWGTALVLSKLVPYVSIFSVGTLVIVLAVAVPRI